MIKSLLAALLVGLSPALVLAQAAGNKPAAKPGAARPAAKPAPGANPKLTPSAQKAVEEATPLEEPDPSIKLSEADIEMARKVYVGDIPCELGASVKITPLRREGFFLVQTGRNRFRMHPVESRTGAIRLEDPVRGAMWLQLGNKSMLMSQKLGQRLADECQSPAQITFAEEAKSRPPVNILEPAPAAQPLATGVVPAGTRPPQEAVAPGTSVPASTAAPATPAASSPLPASSPAAGASSPAAGASAPRTP